MENPLLREVGRQVRARRKALGLTQRDLAARSGLSLRFLAEIERGAGNVSLARFAALARALDSTASALLAETTDAGRVVALLGVRGAGKSTVGRRLARRLHVPFFELDARIEKAAALGLREIFELHGEAYYRRLERETLRVFLDETPAGVLATGGSLVMDRETWRLLRERAATVWLRASAEDHWNRVIRQGDERPMRQNPRAFQELRSLLDEREPLYRQARHVVDTTGLDVGAAVERVARALDPGVRSGRSMDPLDPGV